MVDCWKQRIYELESQLKILREGQKQADIVLFVCTICGGCIENGKECGCANHNYLHARPDGSVLVHMYAHIGIEPYDPENAARYKWNVGQNFRPRRT